MSLVSENNRFSISSSSSAASSIVGSSRKAATGSNAGFSSSSSSNLLIKRNEPPSSTVYNTNRLLDVINPIGDDSLLDEGSLGNDNKSHSPPGSSHNQHNTTPSSQSSSFPNDRNVNNISIDEILLVPSGSSPMEQEEEEHIPRPVSTFQPTSTTSDRIAYIKNKINSLNNQIIMSNDLDRETSHTDFSLIQQRLNRQPTASPKIINNEPVLNNQLDKITNEQFQNSSSSSLSSYSRKFKPKKKPSLKEGSSLDLITKTPQPDLVEESLNDESFSKIKLQGSSSGAFKIYTQNEHVVASAAKLTNNAPVLSEETRQVTASSPFVSIERVENVKTRRTPQRHYTEKIVSNQPTTSNETTTTRNPVKKYRSGSTTSVIREQKKSGESSSRPSTSVNQLRYSLDSDESFVVEELINDPDKLKEKLKQSKVNRDQLAQLQEDYMKLLEQYAEAENFIDAFRVTGQMSNANQTPNIKMFQGTFDLKSNTADLIQKLNGIKNNQGNNKQSRSPTSLASNSINSSHDDSNNHKKLNNPSNESRQKSPTSSNELNQSIRHIDKKSSSTSASSLSLKSADHKSSQHSNPDPEPSVLISPSSKLGILLQSKLLEDKMSSFVTLMEENQLNPEEKFQVLSSIKSDYDSLMNNYTEMKNQQPEEESGDTFFVSELDLNVDLNKELDKMKGMLSDIVDKVNSSLAVNPTDDAESGDQNELKNSDRSSNISSYGNPDELAGQYNRLIDIFNDDEVNQDRKMTSNNKESSPATTDFEDSINDTATNKLKDRNQEIIKAAKQKIMEQLNANLKNSPPVQQQNYESEEETRHDDQEGYDIQASSNQLFSGASVYTSSNHDLLNMGSNHNQFVNSEYLSDFQRTSASTMSQNIFDNNKTNNTRVKPNHRGLKLQQSELNSPSLEFNQVYSQSSNVYRAQMVNLPPTDKAKNRSRSKDSKIPQVSKKVEQPFCDSRDGLLIQERAKVKKTKDTQTSSRTTAVNMKRVPSLQVLQQLVSESDGLTSSSTVISEVGMDQVEESSEEESQLNMARLQIPSKQSKHTQKAVIVNQLNEEVELLKQKILKKHLQKLKKKTSSVATNTEPARQPVLNYDSDILNKTPDEVIVADELDVKPVEARLEEMNVRIDQKSRLIESLSKMIVENCETKYASCSTLHTSGNQLISPYHTTSMVIQTGGSAGVKKSMKCASSVNLSTRNLEDKKELTEYESVKPRRKPVIVTPTSYHDYHDIKQAHKVPIYNKYTNGRSLDNLSRHTHPVAPVNQFSMHQPPKPTRLPAAKSTTHVLIEPAYKIKKEHEKPVVTTTTTRRVSKAGRSNTTSLFNTGTSGSMTRSSSALPFNQFVPLAELNSNSMMPESYPEQMIFHHHQQHHQPIIKSKQPNGMFTSHSSQQFRPSHVNKMPNKVRTYHPVPNYDTPMAQPIIIDPTTLLNKPKQVRYYIREYSDVANPTSDHHRPSQSGHQYEGPDNDDDDDNDTLVPTSTIAAYFKEKYVKKYMQNDLTELMEFKKQFGKARRRRATPSSDPQVSYSIKENLSNYKSPKKVKNLNFSLDIKLS